MNWNDLLSNKRYAQPHKSPDIRSSFQRDYDRIIFSSPFRRLETRRKSSRCQAPRWSTTA